MARIQIEERNITHTHTHTHTHIYIYMIYRCRQIMEGLRGMKITLLWGLASH